MQKLKSPVYELPHAFGIGSDNGAIINAAIAAEAKKCGNVSNYTIVIKPNDAGDKFLCRVITEHEPIACKSE